MKKIILSTAFIALLFGACSESTKENAETTATDSVMVVKDSTNTEIQNSMENVDSLLNEI